MGDAAKVMAVLTFTLPNGQPLIYTGQEIGWNKRFEFFEKDNIPAWEKSEYTDFYKELTALRHNNPALAAGERGGKIEYIDDVPAGVFAFTRAVEGNSVTVYANFTKEPISFNDINLAAWGWHINTK
jgi:glycosidase